MVKTRIYEVTDCNFCGKQISVESPPSKKRYNNAEIHISDLSSILLPESLVGENVDNGHCESHAASLDGYYCNPECLAAYIKLQLTPKERVKQRRRA